ncbi:alpha/beta hydrolase [Kineococcus rhizosphaerae]|nr:alpha/beta hydrolase [Kineococcus rhizosphaerae]
MTRRPLNPLFWTLAQIGSRVRSSAPAGVEDPPLQLPDPTTLRVPTRHGDVDVLVQRPAQPQSWTSKHPPVVVHLHGGGFVNRNPAQDRHIARHLAAHLGAVVLLPDYDTAPTVHYPVAEEEAVDVVDWATAAGEEHGWDGQRLVLSGVSAGAKLSLNTCQQLHQAGRPRPLAAVLVVPVTDAVRTDRTSPTARPAISPLVQRFVGWAYFPDTARRREPLASPRLDPSLSEAMPPTLVLTAEHDTLATEGGELADVLRAGDVEVVHHQYPGVDHGFIGDDTALATVRDALERMVTFFRPHLGEPDAGENTTTRQTPPAAASDS